MHRCQAVFFYCHDRIAWGSLLEHTLSLLLLLLIELKLKNRANFNELIIWKRVNRSHKVILYSVVQSRFSMKLHRRGVWLKISMENITYYGNYLSYQKKEQQSRMVYYAFDHREIHWFNSVLGAHVAALFFFFFFLSMKRTSTKSCIQKHIHDKCKQYTRPNV